jgi:hypothetical protein
MPDANPPGAKRPRSMTVAGILDVVIGGLGLLAAGLSTLAAGVVLTCIAWSRATNPPTRVHISESPGLAVAGPTLVLLGIVLASTLADAWLVATGIQLLRRARSARTCAFVHAGSMIVLGIGDILLAGRAGEWRWILLPLVFPQPIYALAQVAAFYTVPSWKALITTGSEARSTH